MDEIRPVVTEKRGFEDSVERNVRTFLLEFLDYLVSDAVNKSNGFPIKGRIFFYKSKVFDGYLDGWDQENWEL